MLPIDSLDSLSFLSSVLVLLCIETRSLFIHSSVYGHLSSFQFLTVTSETTKLFMYFQWIYASIPLGQIPRSGIPGLYDRWLNNFSRN